MYLHFFRTLDKADICVTFVENYLKITRGGCSNIVRCKNFLRANKFFVSFVPIQMNGCPPTNENFRFASNELRIAPGARSNCFAVNDRVSPAIDDSA